MLEQSTMISIPAEKHVHSAGHVGPLETRLTDENWFNENPAIYSGCLQTSLPWFWRGLSGFETHCKLIFHVIYS